MLIELKHRLTYLLITSEIRNKVVENAQEYMRNNYSQGIMDLLQKNEGDISPYYKNLTALKNMSAIIGCASTKGQSKC